MQNRYFVERLIAQGGMGAVYQAIDQQQGETVALKQSLLSDPDLRKAFEREARMLTRLRHPSLPVVYDYFVEDTNQYLVMQYVPGDDLGTLLERKGRKFPSAAAIPWIMRWADQLLDALSFLHRQKQPVIHRDIKPKNLKVNSKGDVMLLDFGMAKSAGDQTRCTQAQSVRGYTEQYAPLEQIQGTGTDARSDIYAFAATFYHLLTGEPPPDTLTRVAAVLNGQSDPLRSAHELNPLVPPVVAVILHQALDQNKSNRFASATALRKALSMANPSGKTISTVSGSGQVTSTTPTIPVAKTDSSGVPTSSLKPPAPDSSLSEAFSSIGDATITSSGTPTTVLNSGGYDTIVTSTATDSLADQSAVDGAEPEPADGPAAPAPPTPMTDRLRVKLKQGNIHRIRTAALPYPKFIVSQHGQGHYHSINEAIESAQDGTQIVIQPGIYHESLVLDKAIELVGDGPVEDIIIESVGAACLEMKTDYALVRGVTLRAATGDSDETIFAVNIPHGRLILERCTIVSHTTAGVAIHNASARPLLWRCTIQNRGGIGVFFYKEGQGVVEECEIVGNSRAGVKITQSSNPVIRFCTIHHGGQQGVYIAKKGAGTLEECEIFDNEQSGIEIHQEGNPFIRWCRIHHQHNGYGIDVYERGEGIIEGCDIYGNANAGIHIAQSGNPFVRRCQIHDQEEMGIIVAENSQGILDGCDFFNNTRTGVSIGTGSGAGVYQSQNAVDDQETSLMWDHWETRESSKDKHDDPSVLGNLRPRI